MRDPHEATFDASELAPVTDVTPVEHVGGPDDGRWMPLCENGDRLDGMYISVNILVGSEWQVTEKRYVPR